MKGRLDQIREQALAQIRGCDTTEKLNEIRVNILGKKGELTGVLKSMKDVKPEDRPKIGQMVNETREEIERVLEEARTRMEKAVREARMKAEVIDVTLPARKNEIGHRHPNTIALEEVERIFVGMTTTTLRRSTFPRIIPPRTSRTPSISTGTSCCAPRPPACRCTRWRREGSPSA